MLKVVQVAIDTTANLAVIVAVCEDGTVWTFPLHLASQDKPTWRRLPLIPKVGGHER